MIIGELTSLEFPTLLRIMEIDRELEKLYWWQFMERLYLKEEKRELQMEGLQIALNSFSEEIITK